MKKFLLALILSAGLIAPSGASNLVDVISLHANAMIIFDEILIQGKECKTAAKAKSEDSFDICVRFMTSSWSQNKKVILAIFAQMALAYEQYANLSIVAEEDFKFHPDMIRLGQIKKAADRVQHYADYALLYLDAEVTKREQVLGITSD